MTQNMIAILDLGSTQSAQIAREIRALGVYSEIHPHDIAPAALKALPGVAGVISTAAKTAWWTACRWRSIPRSTIWACRF